MWSRVKGLWTVGFLLFIAWMFRREDPPVGEMVVDPDIDSNDPGVDVDGPDE